MTPDSTSFMRVLLDPQQWTPAMILIALVAAFIVFRIVSQVCSAFLYYLRLRQSTRLIRESLNNNSLQSLRAIPVINLTEDDAGAVIRHYNFFDSFKNKEGTGIIHSYEVRDSNGEKVVLDHATGLMWQQAGSPPKDDLYRGLLTYRRAKIYLKELNKKRFAGFNDWRLPTLEEAMSLVECEPNKTNKLHIASEFSDHWGFWTGDRPPVPAAWALSHLRGGYCTTQYINDGIGGGKLPVRVVRRFDSKGSTKQTILPQAYTGGSDMNSFKTAAVTQPERKGALHLRNTPATLSKAEVKAILQRYNFYCRRYGWNKAWNNPDGKGLDNKFELQQNGKVVFDHATGLMWQQSSSPMSMMFTEVGKYLRETNMKKFAGFSDWRLPTLDEAMSLMKCERKASDSHIDPVFDKTELWIWTADQKSTSSWKLWVWAANKKTALSCWVVDFNGGDCGHVPADHGGGRVRLVR